MIYDNKLLLKDSKGHNTQSIDIRGKDLNLIRGFLLSSMISDTYIPIYLISPRHNEIYEFIEIRKTKSSGTTRVHETYVFKMRNYKVAYKRMNNVNIDNSIYTVLPEMGIINMDLIQYRLDHNLDRGIR